MTIISRWWSFVSSRMSEELPVTKTPTQQEGRGQASTVLASPMQSATNMGAKADKEALSALG
jgi:hypothetical protein